MGLAKRWDERRKARSAAPSSAAVAAAKQLRTGRLFEAVELRQDPVTAWELVGPAENSVLLVPDITAKAFTVPGTGPGRGEQQCHVDHDGQATVIEVVEHIENRLAVAVFVSPRPEVPVRMVTSVEPLGTGSVLTYGVEFEIPAQAVWPKTEQDDCRAYALNYLSRVRKVLEDRG